MDWLLCVAFPSGMGQPQDHPRTMICYWPSGDRVTPIYKMHNARFSGVESSSKTLHDEKPSRVAYISTFRRSHRSEVSSSSPKEQCIDHQSHRRFCQEAEEYGLFKAVNLLGECWSLIIL